MPLYELLVIGRCGEAKSTANFFRTVALTIFDNGGNVREMEILGDRLLPKQLIANDKKKHLVGRYMHILFDGNPEVKKAAEATARTSFETMKYRTHRLKDFFNDAQMYKKAARQQSPIIDEDLRNRAFIQDLINIMENKK